MTANRRSASSASPAGRREAASVMTESRGATGGRALLLIDFQHDFLASDGRMPVARHQVSPVLAATQTYIGAATTVGALVIKVGSEFRRADLVRNLLRRGAAIEGKYGTAWDSRVEPPGATYIPKWKGDAFCNPALLAALTDNGIDDVALAGLFASGCITATTKTALRLGFRVRLLADATACRSDTTRPSALSRLSRLGAQCVSQGDPWAADGHETR